MTTARVVQNAFSSGEVDPLLLARSDFMRNKTGLARCSGFLPLRQGAITRAPGTIYRGTTHGNAVARRIPFIFAANDALELEFSDQRMRVWRYGALVEVGGAPFEIATPYTEADLPLLDTAQDGDLIYIVDGRNPVQILSRRALDDWSIAPMALNTGPFQVQNLDEAKSLTFSAATGSITITSPVDVFEADHVGTTLFVQPTDFSAVPIWVGNYTTTTGSYFRYSGYIYQLTSGTKTGVTPPTHRQGVVLTDPDAGSKYTYISDESGIVRITAVTDARTVTADVIKTLPKPAVDDPTYRWAESAWSARQGWPASIGVYERRLFAASTRTEPRTIWASVQGDYTDFSPSGEADGAFGYAIDGDGAKNRAVWIFRARRGLFVGALGEVWRGFSSDPQRAIGPTTFRLERVSPDGASATRPISAYGDPIYITRDETRVQEIKYDYATDGSGPLELSLPNQHIVAVGIAQMVWQSAPGRTAWARRRDGTLAAMVYDPSQEVLGWAGVPLAGGFCEDLCVSPAADGSRDVVTAIVRRTLGGVEMRCVEELADNMGVLRGAQGIARSNHLFCSVVVSGTDIPTVAAPHLAGEAVAIWTDRGAFEGQTVQGDGTVSMDDPVADAIVGLFDDTHVALTLPLTAVARDGDPRGRKMRLAGEVGLMVHQTSGARVAVIERDNGTDERRHNEQDLNAGPVARNEIVLSSGVITVHLPSGHADDIRIELRPRGGEPLTLTAIIADMQEVGV